MKNFTKLALAALLASAATAQGETLAEIYQLALENDATFKASEARFLIDQEGIVAPRKNLLPSFAESASAGYSLGAGKSRSRQEASPNTLPLSQTRTAKGIKTFSVDGLNYSFNVRNWFDFKAAGHDLERAEAQFALDQQNLIVRVVRAYLDVLRASEALRIARSNETESQQRLQNAKERFSVGLVAITDVHQAQATFDNAVVAVLQAEGEFAIRFEALEVLTGKRHYQVAGLQTDFPVDDPAPLDRDQWVDFSLQNNNTLKVAKSTQETTVDRAKSSQYNYTPTVSVSVGGFRYTDTPGSVIDFGNGPFVTSARESSSYRDASVRVSVPVFTWGLNKSQRKVAAQQKVQAHHNYVGARRQVIQSTRTSFVNAKTNAARVRALASAVTSAESAYKATLSGYEVGTQNILD
ncbi:MAG: TolC family protein, partial [Porticoccaceae bacterium]|nr:TolC family protein [Porticoccaceae bacterium]